MNWKKWAICSLVIAGGIAALVLGFTSMRGGSSTAQASQGQAEALIAQKAGISIDTLHSLEAAGLNVAADKGSASGMITADQATKLRALDVSPILDNVLTGLAQTLNSNEQAVFDSLSGGQSLAQVATANGVSTDSLKSGLTSLVQSQLSNLEGQGVLTSVQGTMALSLFNANIDKVINATPGQHH